MSKGREKVTGFVPKVTETGGKRDRTVPSPFSALSPFSTLGSVLSVGFQELPHSLVCAWVAFQLRQRRKFTEN